MITPEQIKEIEKLSAKHESVGLIYEEWKNLNESPYIESYVSIKLLLNEWIRQIDEGRSKIDIFSESSDKTFDRAIKLATEGVSDILTSLDTIRQKMTPEEQKDLQKDKRLSKNMSVAI